MKAPDVVPEKLSNPINVKFLIIASIGITLFHYSANFAFGHVGILAFYGFSIVSPAVTGVMALYISYRYRAEGLPLTKTFQLAYLALGGAYVFVSIGEFLYFIENEIVKQTAYPSIADAAYFPFYPLVLVHLILNISFFKPKGKSKNLIWMFPLVFGINAVFFIINNSISSEIDTELILSHYYVLASSVSLSFTMLGVYIFKKSTVGSAWILLFVGIIMFEFADVTYYYLETTNTYDISHPINLLWNIGYWVVTYALFKHKTAI